ncbi:MAG TPA: hypothetical protein VGA00_10935 [Acidiferrobacterales bacterium]|jgi:hypothetical protein
MKKPLLGLGTAVLAATLLGAAPAQAGDSRVGISVQIGVPIHGYAGVRYAPPPVYYYGPPVVYYHKHHFKHVSKHPPHYNWRRGHGDWKRHTGQVDHRHRDRDRHGRR